MKELRTSKVDESGAEATKSTKLPKRPSKGSKVSPKVGRAPSLKGPWAAATRPTLAPPPVRSKAAAKAAAAAAAAAAALPSLDSVPDEALANILGRITDARLLARCAAVSRRWRRISRQVPVVRLELRKMQAWQAEGFLSAALLERKGVKDFEVRFICSRKHPSEGIRESRLFGCLWRLSSTIESLSLLCPNTVYFKLWTWLAKFPNLYSLRVHCGRIEESPIFGGLQQLRRCEFSRTIISGPMLEDLVKYCPVLDEMIIVGCDPIESLSLDNSSLRSLEVVATEEYPMKSLDLQTPGLKELTICHVDELQMDGSSLLQLGMYSACEPWISSLQNLVSLEMHGKGWEVEAVEHLICSAQSVQHLVMKGSVTGTRPMRIEHYLSPMFYLQTLILESNLLQCFCEGFTELPFDGHPPAFSLRKVALKLFDETKNSTPMLLKVLLDYCQQLQVVILDTTEVHWEDDGVQKELLELQKAERTPRCRVILYDNPKNRAVRQEIADLLDVGTCCNNPKSHTKEQKIS